MAAFAHARSRCWSLTAYKDQIQGRMKEVQGKIKEAAKKR
jgi:hypothetical protein